MEGILAVAPLIALGVAVLGSFFRGVAAMMHEYYRGRAILLSVQQKSGDPPDRLLY